MKTTITFYKEKENSVPVIDWMKTLPVKSLDKCVAWIELLSDKGHMLRRPQVDMLDDGIYELRVKSFGNEYRILYFFDGKNLVVLTNGFIKKTNAVSKKEIKTAIKHRTNYLKNRKKHTYKR